MKNTVFEEKFKVGYSQKDFNLVLKPSFLLQFLQDLATDNAESLGFGYSYIVKHNLMWFLLKYHMEFTNYPFDIEELTVKTEPRGYNKIFAFRDFQIISNNKILGKVTSTWALVDMESKSMANISESLESNDYMKQFEKREDDLAYNKIKPLTKIDREKIFEIKYDDIDVNGHANNTNYIVWAFEPLDFDFRKSHKLKSLDIVYKKEIQYGNNILSQLEINDNMTTHVVKNAQTDEELCLICANWTNL